MSQTNLKQYYPHIYDGIAETDAIIGTENDAFNHLFEECSKAFNNQFILTADESGVSAFEKVLDIIPNVSAESLEFRRQRVINRLSLRSSLSMPFLRQKLDAIIGKDKYVAVLDYDNYTLSVESSVENQSWFEEMYITINSIKPVNIVFINKPLNSNSMLLSEEINVSGVTYNYRLGITWRLGQKPFATFEDKGVYKLSSVSSVRQSLLNRVADFTADEVSQAKINDNCIITAFSVKESSDGTALIEYTVPKANNSDSEITNIQLLNSENEVLTSATVYIPFLDDIVVKHSIKTKEGI